MAGIGRNLAGVHGLSTMVHQTQNREYGEQEELKGISPRAKTKAKRAWRGPATRDGGRRRSYKIRRAIKHHIERKTNEGKHREVRNLNLKLGE